MAKGNGGTRTVRPTSNTRTENYKVFQREMSLADVASSQSYFSHKKGGYVIAMKGRKYDAAESEAAKAMADDGLLVVLTPEGGVKFRTGKSKKKGGDYVYADGLVNGFTFEQQTKSPQKQTYENLVNSVDSALQHARDKNAQVPLIYDRNGSYHREHIEAGIAKFERFYPNTKFKAILVVNKHGRVYNHNHNS